MDDGSCFLAPDLVDGETGAVVDSLDGILGATWVGDELGYIASDGSIGLLDITTGASAPVDARASRASAASSTTTPCTNVSSTGSPTERATCSTLESRRFTRTELPAMPSACGSLHR